MITDVRNFDYDMIRTLPVLEAKKDERKIIDIVTAFDIEATRLPEIEQAVMYIWQFQFGPDITVIGRTWIDFHIFIEKVKQRLKDRKLIVYVHNLSYEFQFLKGVFKFQPEDVFILDDRKILKCMIGEDIEIRCSYMLTNLSLDKLLKKYNVVQRGKQKADGSVRLLEEKTALDRSRRYGNAVLHKRRQRSGAGTDDPDESRRRRSQEHPADIDRLCPERRTRSHEEVQL